MPSSIATWESSPPAPDTRSTRFELAPAMAEWGRRVTTADIRSDLAAYAAKCLMIRTKSGEVRQLVLNRAQRHIHEQLKAQHTATGRVRALILKGRQQGCSTYVAGRFFHRATHERGIRVFILT